MGKKISFLIPQRSVSQPYWPGQGHDTFFQNLPCANSKKKKKKFILILVLKLKICIDILEGCGCGWESLWGNRGSWGTGTLQQSWWQCREGGGFWRELEQLYMMWSHDEGIDRAGEHCRTWLEVGITIGVWRLCNSGLALQETGGTVVWHMGGTVGSEGSKGTLWTIMGGWGHYVSWRVLQ